MCRPIRQGRMPSREPDRRKQGGKGGSTEESEFRSAEEKGVLASEEVAPSPPMDLRRRNVEDLLVEGKKLNGVHHRGGGKKKKDPV